MLLDANIFGVLNCAQAFLYMHCEKLLDFQHCVYRDLCMNNIQWSSYVNFFL